MRKEFTKAAILLALVAALLTGCGGAEDITASDVRGMSSDDTMALLDCQLELAADDMGEKAAIDYTIDLMEEGFKADGRAVPIQVAMWNEDGYQCPELLK